MRRLARPHPFVLTFAAGLLVLGAAGCSSKEDPKVAITNGPGVTAATSKPLPSASAPATTGGTQPVPSIKSSATPTAGNAVTIQDYAFTPGELTVKTGATVTWTNTESDPPVEHWVKTAPGQPGDLDSGKLAPGQTYSKTFAAPGEYAYYCEIHNVMKGKIVVTP